jgi:hypothetical protein
LLENAAAYTWGWFLLSPQIQFNYNCDFIIKFNIFTLVILARLVKMFMESFQVVQQVVAATWALEVINNQSLPIDLKIGEFRLFLKQILQNIFVLVIYNYEL